MTDTKSIPGLVIREETEKERAETERVVREAFFNRYAPGCSEHLVLHQARKAEGFEPWHSLVAEYDGHIIGQVLIVPSVIKTADGEVPTYILGPVCALPACFLRGVGSALMRAMIKTAGEQGVNALFLMGDPRYYHRFGFVSASAFGIHLPGADEKEEADFFMVLPLFEGALDGVTGTFVESDVYKTEETALKAYDSAFPPRVELKLPGQLR